jgi:ABC-type lipoprotein release transport system permease subunit
MFFYLRYAARNLRRSARWTIFAVFCIGAGVATVVALRSLGLAIGDSLIDNVRNSLHGDVRLSKTGGMGGFGAFTFVDDSQDVFSERELLRIDALVEENGGTYAMYGTLSGLQVTRLDAVSVGRPQFVSAYVIDPETYPPTGDIRAADPSGVSLHELFTGEGNEVVISRNLADQQGIAVGDTVRISNTTEEFIVRGIVPTETEAGVTNIFASFFGFVYVDVALADVLQVIEQPNTISVALPDTVDPEEFENRIGGAGVFASVDNRVEWIERYEVVSDYIGRFIVIMGLGALLIGGVGIINTMLVMVGRRTSEIAALKTFGLKGRQIFWLFMSEAFLLGVFGSILGCVIGVFLSVLVNQYGEALLQQGLTWRLYPEALLYGLGLGMVVTLVFGVLPILTANKVRPATILRPNETVIPRTGVLHSIIALLLVVIVIGGVAGRIIGEIPIGRGRTIPGELIGMGGVAFTLIIMGFLVAIFWFIVWIVSRLPSFGVVDLRLALRNMTARRVRTATTLLALTAGMFALSAITFIGVGTREILQIQLSQNLGGNVLVFPVISLVSNDLGQGLLNAQLNNIDGIQYRTQLSNYSATLLTVDGVVPEITLPDFIQDEMPAGARRAFASLQIVMRETDNPNLTPPMIEGRFLTPEDEGRNVIVIPETFANQFSNVTPRVGSHILLNVDGPQVEFEVVGITEGSSALNFGQYYVPSGAITVDSDFELTILQTEPDKLNEVLLALSSVPFVFTLDITFIDSFLTRLIDQFSAIPTLVGLLSLLAAAVTMANTVSLATLERRRQIGILKAVGLKGRRVLTIMLIENTIIGLLGGLLGLGVSALIVAAMTSAGAGISIPLPREAAPLAIALLIASVAIAFISTFLSASVAIRERVANVLRYE